MPGLRPELTRTFHRCLYAGQLQRVTLIKRGDDQQQGVSTNYTLWDCRRGTFTRQGETIKGDMSAEVKATWHIPRVELDRVRVAYLNPLDVIVDADNRYWQNEATGIITVKLFENMIVLECLRIDPPGATVQSKQVEPSNWGED